MIFKVFDPQIGYHFCHCWHCVPSVAPWIGHLNYISNYNPSNIFALTRLV